MESSVINAVEDFVKEYMSHYKDSSHDWLHVNRVRKLALKLAEKEMSRNPSLHFDLEMVQLGAMLHDVGDFKYATNDTDNKQIITQLLTKLDYPSDKIKEVIEIVEYISYRHELEFGCSPSQISRWNEFTVVQDADRLDAIGAIGIARCFAYNGRKNLPFYVEGERPNSQITAEEYNAQTAANKGSARFHFDEKLLKLKDIMKSEAGKVEAIRRHSAMVQFLANFDEDCGLSFSL